jgi:hypothetical protein
MLIPTSTWARFEPATFGGRVVKCACNYCCLNPTGQDEAAAEEEIDIGV